MMDLEELKDKWAEHDQKIEQSFRLNRRVLGALHLNRAQSALQRLTMTLAIGAATAFVCVAALGEYIYTHISAPRFALPAAALDVLAIGCLIGLIRQIVALSQIDYNLPIAGIQKQLARVRVMRIRYLQVALLGGTVLWTAALIVVLHAFFGVDAYQLFSLSWFVANTLFGLALIPAAIWVSRKYGERMEGSPFLRGLMRDLAGYSLNRATAALADLAKFERE